MDDKEILKQIERIENIKYGEDGIYIKKILNIKKDITDYICEKRDKNNKYPKGKFMDEYISFLNGFKLYKQYKEEEHNEFVNIIIEYISSHKKLNNIQKDSLLEIINKNI